MIVYLNQKRKILIELIIKKIKNIPENFSVKKKKLNS